VPAEPKVTGSSPVAGRNAALDAGAYARRFESQIGKSIEHEKPEENGK